MTDICLIFTPIHELLEDELEAPLGLLYLATYLNENGKEAVVCDLSGRNLETAEIPSSEWYGFATYSPTYLRTLMAKEKALAVNPKAKTVAGGPHASSLPKEVASDFDYVILDEGESALLGLLNGEVKGTPAFDITSGGYRTPEVLDGEQSNIIQGEAIWELDDIPFPDYDLVEVTRYKREVAGKHSFSMLSSRGCPFKCKFCNSKIMGGGTRLRYRSPENVVAEMKSLLDKYGDIGFRFQDDIFGMSIKWLREFTELVKPLDIVYRAFVRAHQCAIDGFTDLLYEGGCRHVSLGIESGSQKILDAMVKGCSVETNEKGIANAKRSGLIVRTYYIVGYPGETWDTVGETADFVKKAKPDEFVVYPFIPYPGTDLFYHPEAHGLYNIDPDFKRYFQIKGQQESEFVYDLADYDRDELERMKQYLIHELSAAQAKWAIHSEGWI